MAQLTARELDEWMAYYMLEPFGETRHDLQAGIVASTVVNLFGDRKGKPLNPGDFVLFQDAVEKKPKEAKEIYNQFRSWAMSLQARQ